MQGIRAEGSGSKALGGKNAEGSQASNGKRKTNRKAKKASSASEGRLLANMAARASITSIRRQTYDQPAQQQRPLRTSERSLS